MQSASTKIIHFKLKKVALVTLIAADILWLAAFTSLCLFGVLYDINDQNDPFFQALMMASVISVLFTAFQLVAVILEHYIATCIFSIWQAVVIVKTICFAIFFPLVWVDIALASAISLLKVLYIMDLKKLETISAERRRTSNLRQSWDFFARPSVAVPPRTTFFSASTSLPGTSGGPTTNGSA